MLRIWTLAILITISNPALAANKRSLRFDTGRSGIGGVLGKPAVFRYNYWLNWKRSLFLDVGYNWEQVMMASFSYAFYFYDVKDLWKSKNKTNALLFYLAPGVFTGYNFGTTDPSQTIYLGGKVVGGVEYLFAGLPISLRAEVGPAIYALGKTIGGIQGGVGITYYLGSVKDSEEKDSYSDEMSSDTGVGGAQPTEQNLDDEFADEAAKETPKPTPKKVRPATKATSDELELEKEFNSAPAGKSKAPTKVSKPAPKGKKPPAKEDLSEFE